MADHRLDTHAKALKVNLDPVRYGTFAEIGAGQEVARWFFRVGGAAGSVAKAMSAYDMVFSDAIYGQSDRYVSRSHLQTMLDHEYGLLIDRATGSLVTAGNLRVEPHLAHLCAYLVENRLIEALRDVDERCLPIYSREVL